MSALRRAFVAAAAIGLVLAGGSTQASATGDTEDTTAPPIWAVAGSIKDVARAPDSDTLWVIKANRPASTYLIAWYAPGVGWSSFTPPDDATLYDITMVSDTEGWAVGEATVDGVDVPYVLHWNGTTWERYRPAGLGTGWMIESVSASASDNVWLTASRVNDDDATETTIWHWDGSMWSSTFEYAEGQGSVEGPVAVGSADGWLAVHDGAEVSYSTLYRWDGSAWVESELPEGIQVIHELASSGDSMWMSGYQVSSWSQTSLMWDGSAWVEAPLPDELVNTLVTSLAVAPDGSAWAAGEAISLDGDLFTVGRYVDGMWEVIGPDNPCLENRTIHDVTIAATSADDVYIGGKCSYGDLPESYTLLMHYDGTEWTRL